MSRLVDGQGKALNPVGVLVANNLTGLVGADVLVLLAEGRLGRGRVDGAAGERLATLETCGLGDAVDGALGLVFGPGAARDVAADDGLDGEDAVLVYEHGASPEKLPVLGREGLERSGHVEGK